MVSRTLAAMKALAPALVLLVIAGGCAPQPSPDGTGPAPAPAVASERSLPPKSSTEPIVATMQIEPDLKEVFPAIEALLTSRSTQLVVNGVVSDVSYRVIEGTTIVKTRYTVAISQAWRGPNPGSVVVEEDGGLAPASVFHQANTDKGLPAPSVTDGLVDVRFQDAPHPAVGQRVLIALQANPNDAESWFAVSSAQGRLTWDPSLGSYVRAAKDPGLQSSAKPEELTGILPGLRP